jgi:hypothetical protein
MSEDRDVFEQLASLVRPERLLQDPRATGAGVRIAIVDSGIDRATLDEKFAAIGTAIEPIEGGVFVRGQPTPLPYTGSQSAPHGTTVADIILTIAPKARIFSADVFGSRGSCDVESLIHAIGWAVHNWRCNIINLSLGVPEAMLTHLPRRQQLQRTIEDAYYHDVMVLAAAHNEHPLQQSYPARFAPPLLSVDKQVYSDPLQFAYRLNEGIEFQAHARGYLGPFAHEPATSWAAPHLAGIVARLLSLRPGLKPFEVKTLLYWMFQGNSHAKGLPGGGSV